MTLYSYIVKYDGGFAPNPFFGYCTLACCKPGIRKHAKKADWIVGLTPRAKGKGNKIVYLMKVKESLSFDKYWRDPRFRHKKPKLNAGIARKCGDNIYKPQAGGGYLQLQSAHSHPEFGIHENAKTKKKDLSGKRVLIATNFYYFGSEPIELPPDLDALKVGIGYKSHFPDEVKSAFLDFVKEERKVSGSRRRVLAPPSLWKTDDGSWKSVACGR
jgi:Nucleotide modification associated domain 2